MSNDGEIDKERTIKLSKKNISEFIDAGIAKTEILFVDYNTINGLMDYYQWFNIFIALTSSTLVLSITERNSEGHIYVIGVFLIFLFCTTAFYLKIRKKRKEITKRVVKFDFK
jgi:hypothetical protein